MKIQDMLIEALKTLQIPQPTQIQIERTKHPDYGHFSTNLAMMLTKTLRRPPMEIAGEIVKALPKHTDIIEKVEVKAPGFINFFMAPKELQTVVDEILKSGSNYGRSIQGKGKKAQVEFVSANPTGPLTVGHGRQAVLGDSVARILEWNGYEVEREYYYNDAGRQMRILGHSTFVRYRQALGFSDEFPEDHYQGEYISDIAKKIVEKYGDRFKDDPENEIFKNSAEQAVFEDIKATLKRIDIEFDCFYNEKSLYENGEVDAVLKKFEEIGASYEKDGAIWFRAGQYGGSDDRVLWKSVMDEATYRLPDIAYHTTKYKRGFDIVVDIFGADHHATYPDVLAGLKALGYDTSRIKVLIHQFVTLTRGTEKVKMSTRKANYVTVDELIDEVGKDVVRYFFIMRGMNSQLNFDLALAKTEGEENPVFYLQYAHARICSILRNAKIQGIGLNEPFDEGLLQETEALSLLNVLSEFPEVVGICHDTLEPQHMTTYMQKLATAFHKFYTDHRVLTSDRNLSVARIALVRAVRTVLSNGLSFIGISAPEKM
ncbi:MAG: arginine--tRNA ligase [Candidatus Marinimicrobia bacterium]|nr:arginine--tRNA ligase [Candidatus Neomarinimicrobiota bacterium]